VRRAAATWFGAGLILSIGPALPATADDVSASPGVSVADARKASELKTGTLSNWITSCDYGIRRLGDDGEGPPKLVLLKQDLDAALPAALAGKTLTISKYAVFVNVSAALRRGTYGSNPGIVGAVMSGMGSNCSREGTTDGWYGATEVTSVFSPIVVEVEATLDGKAFSARIVYSPDYETEGEFGERFWSGGHFKPEALAALTLALHRANAALAEQLRNP
jgi:hypothetical protein